MQRFYEAEKTAKTAAVGSENQFAAYRLCATLHKEFVFIHPFVDGNGRVARLLMNIALMQAGYTIALISPLKRAEYISALEAAHKNDAAFITLIAESVYETQKDFLRMMNGEERLEVEE